MRSIAILVLFAVACVGVDPVEPIGTTMAPSTASLGGSGDTTMPAASDDTAGTTAGSSGSSSGPGADESGSTTSATCPVGSEGCPCTSRDVCDPGLQCLSMFCVDTGQRCPIGAEGCPCTDGGACDPGLQCASMVCVDPDG